ncbi:MAG TPA: FAD binding domain-containing protein, partial [Nitrospirales bacterium]|nr:FAD binding domain-containing protein [Nitrospirales bacterium]
INSCLHPLPQVDGQALLTVEDLKTIDGHLHPVQQALVEAHASQCGYCTPGIVMSLFALYQSGDHPDREAIVNALTGNLCRCTGYRPIIDAALCLFESDRPTVVEGNQRMNQSPGSSGRLVTDDSILRKLLDSIKRSHRLSIQESTSTGKTNRYLLPVNLAELSDMLGQYENPVLLAGGTDIGPLVSQKPQNNETIIFIGKVKELRGMVLSDSSITIGAATTLTEVYPVIARYYPAFGELLLRFGSPAVRNLATIGGNIAGRSPVSDTATALIALDSTMAVRVGSTQRTLSVEAFQIGAKHDVLAPGEFIESISLPLPKEGSMFSAYKITKRHDCDIAAIAAAFSMELKDNRIHQVRVCYGGMSPYVKRATHCERALTGMPWTPDTIETAGQLLEKDFEPTTDRRASSGYRMLVAKNLLQRWYFESTLPPESLQVRAYQKTYE